MQDKELIPLHTHSVYSLLDGLIKVEDYVKWGLENKMPALALTEHGSMASAIRFYKECNKNNIKPILGMESYTTLDMPNAEKKNKDNFHLVLLCKNKTGWLNLIKLHNLSFHNFHYKPRITYNDLKKYSEGLICLSACLGGAIPKSIINKDNNAIKFHTETLKNIFKDDFYIELQDHNLEVQRPVNNILIQIANSYNIKLIATNDSHYANKEDAFAHQVLLCKQTGSKISDENKMSFGTEEFYLKNTEQMRQQLAYLGENIFLECLQSSEDINSKIETFDILQHEYNYPKFGEPQESLSKLKHLIEIGFVKRFAGKNIEVKKYTDRLSYELQTISKIGFTDYFLMLADLYEYCRKENITTGFGRGSAPGSLVLYCIFATELDPIEHKLMFERFINPERISAPDVDFDVSDLDRQKVISYLTKKYGVDYTCNIATYGNLTSVSAFKAVASVLELPFQEANKISKDLLDTSISLQENLENSDELKKLYNTRTDIQTIINTAIKLEGGKEKRGIHAAGIVISNQPLENLTPVMYIQDTSGNYVNCSSFEMKEIDGDLKLLKLDILGLKNLSIVKEAIDRIGNDMDFKTLDFKDENTYKIIQKAETLGVFQLESDVMKHLCKEIVPKNLADISIINAGARPGALESGLTQSFINRRKGLEEIDYVVDGMEVYLKDTLGTFPFQENLMQLSQVMAGYTGGEADNLRKIVGKKLIEKLVPEREKFIKGSIKNGHSEEKANKIFDMIEKFGRYGFNASHSMAYSALSYTTAYLKANYPLEYMTALLNANSDNLDKLTPYIDECYRLGINVLPPDINKSGHTFEHDKENNAIRFGFNGIKHVGESSVELLILERENGVIKSFSDLLARVPSLNKTALESLIKVGAFNNIEQHPYKFLHTLEYMQKAKNKTDYKNGKVNLYNSLINVYIKETSKHNERIIELSNKKKGLTTKKADKELKIEIDSEIENIYKEEILKFDNMDFTPDIQILKDYEMELIGFPVSNNPKKEIMELSEFIDNTSIEQIKEDEAYDELFYFIGKIKTVRRCRNGSYFVIITDEKTDISTFIKGETYALLSDKLENTSNYFRICGKLNRSNNPNYDDNLKLESIRYFNTSKDKEVILRMPQTMNIQDLETLLTNIKCDAIMNSEDINFRLSILTYDNKKINTKIDYWISNVQSIGSYIIKKNMTVVN